jgi:predicted TIM-barrel fold metal-dependent hydrolase
MKIRLQEGIDIKFFKLLKDLYAPLLSSHHLNDRFQFTIYSDEYPFPVGIISINQGKNSFMQFALIPDARGRGIAQDALMKITSMTKSERVGWGCQRINYPSLKILHDYQGGIFENSTKNSKGKSYEGFFRIDKPVSTKMQDALAMVLPASNAGYQIWLKSEYAARNKQRTALRNYLFERMSAIDAHFHVHSNSLSSTEDSFVQSFGRHITPSQVISAMDRCHVGRTIVFGVPSVALNINSVNEFVRCFASQHPDRLIPFAVLADNSDTAKLAKEGFKGFKEHVYGLKIQKDDGGCHRLVDANRKKLYHAIANLRLPLIAHFGPNIVRRVEDILETVPTLDLIIAHLGSSCNGPTTWCEIEPVLKSLSPFANVHFDTSAIKDVSLIEKAITMIGADRIVWGSDWPVEGALTSISRILASEQISIFDMYNIVTKNTQALLGLNLSKCGT